MKKIKIIGRTKINVDKKLAFNALTKNEYYFISKKTRQFLIKNKINKLPIDLITLIKKNKWEVSTFNKCEKLIKMLNIDPRDNHWGFTLHYKNKYLILYDENLTETEQRFTLAHEIGHIILNHFYKAEDLTRELAANMFATRLLMPICVLYECKVEKPKDIELLCGVSSTYAIYRFNRLNTIKNRNKFYTDYLEVKVKNNFKNFIENHLC